MQSRVYGGRAAVWASLFISILSAGCNQSRLNMAQLSNTLSSQGLLYGPPAQLQFSQQPEDTQAANQILVEVKVLDSVGRLVPTSLPMTVSYVDKDGNVQTFSATSANGIATFNNISISAAGSGYVLQASASGLTAAQSNSFNITPSSAASLTVMVQPTSVAAGNPFAQNLQVAVQDASNNIVTTSTAPVTLTISGNGVLMGTATVAATNGIATFPGLLATKVGTAFTLAASSGALTTATTTAFNVTSGTASKLAFVNNPADTVSGAPFAAAVTISISDAFGNLATNAANPVTVTASNGVTNFPTTATLTPANGIATLATNFVTTASNTETLTASSTGLTPATSTPYKVLPAAAAKLLFTMQPQNSAAGAAIAVQVAVEDSFSNLIVNATNPVTMTVSGGVTLGGTTTVVPTGGLSNFTNLTVTTAGNAYTLTAASTGLTSATSTAFAISPATPAALTFTTEPQSPVQTNVIMSTVAVTAKDQFGNVTTNTTTPVTLTLGNNNVGALLGGTTTENTVGGVATFANLTLNISQAGFTLIAAATGLTSATSTPFTVTTSLSFKSLPQGNPTFTQLPSFEIFDGTVSGGALYVPTMGGLAISNNNGGTFSTTTTVQGLPSNEVFSTVVSGANLFAGTQSGIALSTNGGTTFTTLGPNQGVNGTVSGYMAAAGNNVYAAGTTNFILISTNGGATFFQKAGNFNSGVSSVAASGNNVYVSTYSNGLFISDNTSTNGFTQVTTAQGLASNTTYKVVPVGNAIYVSTFAGISVSTNGGASFTKLPIGAGLAVLDIAVSGNTIAAVYNAQVNISNDGGQTVAATYNAGGRIVQGVFFSGGNIYAQSFGGGLGISVNGGVSFTLSPVGIAPSDWVNDVYASGTTVYVASMNGGFYYSNDGGNTFSQSTTLNYSGGAAALCVSGGSIYVETFNAVEVSTDGGVTFTRFPLPNGANSNSNGGNVYATGASIYAGTSEGLAVSRNGGTTFSLVTSGLPSTNVNSITGSGNSVFVGTSSGLTISNDGGNTFTASTASAVSNVVIMKVFTTNGLLYVGTTNGLAISSDGGKTFTKAQGIGGTDLIESVFTSGTNIYATVYEKGVIVSNDGGNTWTSYTTAQGLGDNFTTGVYATGGNVYVGTYGGLALGK